MTTASPDPAPASVSQPPDFDQRLLAEAVRFLEEGQDGLMQDPNAERLARQADGDLEQRLVVRARSLDVAGALRAALEQLRGSMWAAILVGVALAGIAGASSARLALGSHTDTPVNFFWLLSGILGVHACALALWLMLACLSPRAMSAGSLGGVALKLARRCMGWLHRAGSNRIHLAAVQASVFVLSRSPVGRWGLSALTHALWLAFLGGALTILVLILSVRQHTFVWETTILSEPTFVSVTSALAAGPRALGLPTPSRQQVIASRSTAPAQASAERAWSGLLIGSILVYGVLPRLVLVLGCAALGWRARRRYRLDTEALGYQRLHPRVMPGSATLGVVDADSEPAADAAAVTTAAPVPVCAHAPVAVLGLEIEQPTSGWPPPLEGVDWLDCGFVNTREERADTLQRLADVQARLAVVVCAATATPDRGSRAFIDALRQNARAPLAVLLTEGQRLRERVGADEVMQRFADWRRVVTEAGVSAERVIDCDLNHLTAASQARLAPLIGAPAGARAARAQIEAAFDLIGRHVDAWTQAPSTSEQAELHRDIAKLYQQTPDAQPSWQRLLRARPPDRAELGRSLKTSAERMVGLLPARLRADPRWLAAGATAGAMGCVAAATLVTPVAIASLPLWAGMGSALSVALRSWPQPRSEADTDSPVPAYGTAVRSAALFTVVLELQGRDEAAITRVIDRVADDESSEAVADIGDAEAARRWLAALKERFDQALTDERAA